MQSRCAPTGFTIGQSLEKGVIDDHPHANEAEEMHDHDGGLEHDIPLMNRRRLRTVGV
jgi:hypothetical protein